jgi:amino acid adenylation domain-containing protein
MAISVDRAAPPRRAIPTAWTDGPRREPPTGTVLDRYRRNVAHRPRAVAVTSGPDRLSYAELDRLAGRVAALLVARGVRPGDRVGVLVPRSALLPVALLGTWTAGAVYVPVDPEYPAERIRYLLGNCDARLVLTQSTLVDRIEGHPAVALDAEAAPEPGPPPARPAPGLLPAPPAPDDPAYVVYTSGSTGQPKGVEVSHRSLSNVIAELADVLHADADRQWLTMAPASFDISLAELCLPLWTGARVAVTSGVEARDAARLVRLIADLGVDRMQAVPAQWQALLDAGLDAPDLVGMVGGEALPLTLAHALTVRIRRLVNGYGPTETTIVSTVWPVPAGATGISLGRPIANTRVYVLDDERREVPVGEPGELYIAGAGVAQAYLDRPDLTAVAFLPDPHGPAGTRMYRTGDRCRWRPDGGLEYLGRTDGQVKVRGQRIELGEIEACLMRYPGVTRAAVVPHEQSLVAYVAGTGVVPARVREFAAAALTGAMVPAAVVVLDAFPLTPNGKVDRAALPTPAPQPPADPAPVPVADAHTAALCALIAEALGVAAVRPGDDFFELGGTSLAVMKVAAVLAQRWSVQVPAEVFYDAATVADLAVAIRALPGGAA